MKKRILVYKGESKYNVLRLAADEMCKGFREKGYMVDCIDVYEEGALEKIVQCLKNSDQYDFYFSIQALLWNMEAMQLPLLQNIYKVGWIVDDPVYHSGRLLLATGERETLFFVRDSHVKLVKEQYAQFKDVRVLYHGGFECEEELPYEKKDIDVFFAGSYRPMAKAEKALSELDGIFGTIAMSVKDRIVGRHLGRTWYKELKVYLSEVGFFPNEEEEKMLLEQLASLDQYQRDYMRQMIIEELLTHGIKVSVVGAGWSAYDGKGKENLKILSDEGLDILEVIKLMQRSKIVINNTNITDGMHERIFTAMLAKAVCVTNESMTVERLLRVGEEIIEFPLDELTRITEIIQSLLSNPGRTREIAEAGYKKAKQDHTWTCRGKWIIEYMERLLEDG